MRAFRKKSRQKIQGIKLKYKNRKRKQCHPEFYTNTQHKYIILHIELIINSPFTSKNTKKVCKTAEVIQNSLSGKPKSKVRTFINVINLQIPVTEMDIIPITSSTLNIPQEIDLTLYDTLKKNV